jgi:membrane-bound lytic murein transglycosylase D
MTNNNRPTQPPLLPELRTIVREASVVAAAFALAACSLLPPTASEITPSVEPEVRLGASTEGAEDSAAPEPNRSVAELRIEPPIVAPEPEPEQLDLDLLAQLRARFTLERPDDPAVDRELQWYANHPEYLDRVFRRAGRYLHYIAGTLASRDLPAELALLPVVESAFDPFAYSHGQAAGLWQIIPSTGRHLGLKQNWWFDGRRDIIASTRAALDYLEGMHAEFDGDWLLAVAGYTSGDGNVRRARARATKAGNPTDFWHIAAHLPRETRTYVPRLLAITALVADPAAYGITLPEIADEPTFAVVSTGGQIDIALAAELAGLEAERVYELNPGLNRWATDPDGPHRLLLPTDALLAFTTGLARLGDRERVRWARHRIRNGQTLIHIARQYGTTPEVLRQVNNIRGSTIVAGQYLMVPHAVKDLTAYTKSVEAGAERLDNQSSSGQRYEHAVQPGETLWAISRRYSVSTRELASWNSMAPGDVLSVGRQLVVWTNRDVAAQPASNADRIRRLTYTVRSGDSLSGISTRFRVSVAELARWNSLSTEKYLQPGQRLVLYVDVTEQS